MNDTDETGFPGPTTIHWNKETAGTGPFRRRDIVRVCSLREGRPSPATYEKRVGQVGEVSAVHDDYEVCSVLMNDGYYCEFYFDELVNTGEKGSRFPEIHVVPCEQFS